MGPLIAQFLPDHVVVRLYLPWERISQDHSRAQIASAQAQGCTVSGYLWLYRGADPELTAVDALLLANDTFDIPVLWVDVEEYPRGNGIVDPPPTEDEVRRCCEEIERHGIRAGIYTSRSMWRLTGGGESCSGFLLWDAEHSAWLPPDAGYDPGYGGWNVASGRQWGVEDTGLGYKVDRNVFLESVTR